MAQPRLEKFRRRGLAMKLQDVAGTAVDPDPGVDGIRLYNGTAGTEFDRLTERRALRHFSGEQFGAWNHRAFITGEIQLYPPPSPGEVGGSTPDSHVPLAISGMQRQLAALAVRYRPISQDIPCATADYWHAGTMRRLIDARASISALKLEIGQRATAQLRLLGFYGPVLDEDLPAITVGEEMAPLGAATNAVALITVGGGGPLHIWAKALTVDCGTRLTPKHYTSHREINYADRVPTWSLRMARTSVADFDPWALRAAGTVITTSLRVSGDDGRYTELGARGQIDDIGEMEIDGDYGWELKGPCLASDAGGDEFWLEFGTTGSTTLGLGRRLGDFLGGFPV